MICYTYPRVLLDNNSIYLVFLLEIIISNGVTFRVMDPAKANLAVIAIIYLCAVISHTDGIPMVYLSNTSAHGAFSMLNAAVYIPVDIIRAVNAEIV